MLSSVHGFGELAGDVDVALGHRGNGRGVDLVARLGVTRPRDGAIAREVLEETRAPSGCGPRCAHTGTPRWACRRGCGPPRGPAAAGSSARCCARRTGRNWCAGTVDGLGAEHPVEFLLQPVGGLVAETFVGRCRTPRTQGRQAAAPGRRGGSASVTTTSRAGGRRRPRAGAPARGLGAHGGDRDLAAALPQRRGQLGARRVVGAHEHHPRRRSQAGGDEVVQGVGFQAQVSAPMVPLGPHPLDHSGLVGQLHVVRQQVAGQPQLSPDFAR